MFWMNLPGNSAVMGSHFTGRSGTPGSLSATAGRVNGRSMGVIEQSCQEIAAAGERRRGSHRLQARVIGAEVGQRHAIGIGQHDDVVGLERDQKCRVDLRVWP